MNETLTKGLRGLRAEIHLAVHADGRWCEFPNEGGTAESCNQECAAIADVAMEPLVAFDAMLKERQSLDSLQRKAT